MSLLISLDQTEKKIAEAYFQPVIFKKGACLLQQGDPGDGCYLIDQGEVRLELVDFETDSDNVLGYIHPGMFLGEFSLLDCLPRSASAYAETDVQARWLSCANFGLLCEAYPKIGLAISNELARNLAAKLRYYTARISEYVFAGEADAQTNQMVAQAQLAQKAFAGWSEPAVDALLGDMAQTVAGCAEELARECVEETGMGLVQDKVTKIQSGALRVYQALAGSPAAGVLQVDEARLITEIAAPMGVIFGMIPLTNPVSTIIFKSLVCLKSRNALIYSCHHNSLEVGNHTGEIIRAVLRQHGAPPELVSWVPERTSRRKTAMLLKHPGIAFILATGGPSLVKAAYSSGKPAIGVGAGNAPVWICTDADLSAAARMAIDGKAFDNGVICGSENNLVVESAIRAEFILALQANGAALLNPDEKRRFIAQAFDDGGQLERTMIGKTAQDLAARTGIVRAGALRVIVIPATLEELDGPLGLEKLAPILSLFTVDGDDQALQVCKRILENQGRGHTAVIHTQDQARAARFGLEMEASRILVNVSAPLGCIGLGTGLAPSLTLGCGTFGGNSTTDNVTYRHLLNIKRLASGWGERS
jgi:acyl-CoA reductase-like NAD-dependent aldehyde dehydrogenase